MYVGPGDVAPSLSFDLCICPECNVFIAVVYSGESHHAREGSTSAYLKWHTDNLPSRSARETKLGLSIADLAVLSCCRAYRRSAFALVRFYGDAPRLDRHPCNPLPNRRGGERRNGAILPMTSWRPHESGCLLRRYQGSICHPSCRTVCLFWLQSVSRSG